MEQLKILFVEDEPMIRRELGEFLQRYTTNKLCVASNGKEGLEAFHACHPDIVISDIKMPKINGIDMIKAVREINPTQAVILTTAHSDSDYFLEAIDLQVDGYILKPIDLKKLDKKIIELSERIILKKQYDEQKTIMNEIAHLQGSLLAVIDKKKELLFLNDKALSFLGIATVEEAILKNRVLAENMVKREDCFYPSHQSGRSWIEEIQLLEPHRRIIALKQYNKEKVKTYAVDITYVAESKHTILSLSEVTKMEEEKKMYQNRVYKDDLTQLHNRAMLNKQLDLEIQKAKDEKKNLSMIVIDIDYFKEINDQYGHTIGDEVLIELSKLIEDQVRSRDLFVRWGGEEFVILLPDTDLKGACALADELRRIIESHLFCHDISMTCSFGVALMKDNDNLSLFRKADAALYKAKLGGRNKVVIY
ncbi:MAG: diguanylate cyclase [Sulfurovum sp.]|nr:diguanylate cyclase [Sulfurovum sp.]